MDETLTLYQQIVKTQQLFQQGLAELERALRGLTLAAAQTNAELTLQSRRINMLDGKLSRLEAMLNASSRTEWPQEVKP